MKKILIIGIGAGDPDYITIQAVKALNRVDVFFLLEKGADKAELIELRKEICRRHITNHSHRFVDADSPAWARDAKDYLPTIDALNQDKRALFERLIAHEMAEGECGAFLVWGDPAIYDSTIRILEAILAGGAIAFDYEVIPGISSVQALAAKHRIPLNRIGETIEITTGRKLAEGLPDRAGSVVVMLDGDNAYRRFVADDIDIYWGAYLGTPDELLVSGKLADVAGEIERVRAEARRRKGWIMDTYLMRKGDGG
jgi:precorrin-6A synthase